MDTLTPAQRSERMRRIKGKDTKPELAVRKLLSRLGYRFRVHVKELPGRPDIVFSRRWKIINVNGCFWHGHVCQNGRIPKTRSPFWREKFASNRARDQRNEQSLTLGGWQILTIWECEVRGTASLSRSLVEFLGPTRAGRKLPPHTGA